MRHAERLWVAVAGLIAATAAQALHASPLAWLDRMNDAVRQLDYEGRLVVQSGDKLDAIYLVHRVVDGIEKERIVSLTGEPREVIRSDEAVACLIPGQGRHINVGRNPANQSISPLKGVSAAQLAQSYRMQTLTPEIVAGRRAQQIVIEPRDDFRYGYRLFVDIHTALPLRSIMFDKSRRPVSQMMFTEIRINEAITPIEHDLSAMQLARIDDDARTAYERPTEPAWRVADLPPGFQLNAFRKRAAADGDAEHLIFSDGLATLSVYIQRTDGHGLSGESRFGAAKAVGRIIGEHEVIVMGEVPLATLHWVAQHVEPVR